MPVKRKLSYRKDDRAMRPMDYNIPCNGLCLQCVMSTSKFFDQRKFKTTILEPCILVGIIALSVPAAAGLVVVFLADRAATQHDWLLA